MDRAHAAMELAYRAATKCMRLRNTDTPNPLKSWWWPWNFTPNIPTEWGTPSTFYLPQPLPLHRLRGRPHDPTLGRFTRGKQLQLLCRNQHPPREAEGCLHHYLGCRLEADIGLDCVLHSITGGFHHTPGKPVTRGPRGQDRRLQSSAPCPIITTTFLPCRPPVTSAILMK